MIAAASTITVALLTFAVSSYTRTANARTKENAQILRAVEANHAKLVQQQQTGTQLCIALIAVTKNQGFILTELLDILERLRDRAKAGLTPIPVRNLKAVAAALATIPTNLPNISKC